MTDIPGTGRHHTPCAPATAPGALAGAVQGYSCGCRLPPHEQRVARIGRRVGFAA